MPFERYWQAALHDGLVKVGRQGAQPRLQGRRRGRAWRSGPSRPPSGFELLLRPGTQVHDGRYANNGWLQELPDPITKATWGNPLSVSVADAKALGLQDGDLVEPGAWRAQARACR